MSVQIEILNELRRHNSAVEIYNDKTYAELVRHNKVMENYKDIEENRNETTSAVAHAMLETNMHTEQLDKYKANLAKRNIEYK